VSVDPAGVRTAIVTGASSGIGAATALELGRLGWRVALGARRGDRLEAVAERVRAGGGEALAHRLDVALPDSVEEFHTAVEAALGPVDVLINNAGMSILNRLAESRVEDLQRELAVNLLGPMLMCRRALPSMLERRSGDLVFISSENAERPRPYQPAYTAAKAGLEALAGVLEMELEGSGVRASVVRVGPTGSEFGAGFEPAKIRETLEAWKYWGVQRHLHWMPAASVARAVVQVVTTPLDEAHLKLVQVMPGGRKRESAS